MTSRPRRSGPGTLRQRHEFFAETVPWTPAGQMAFEARMNPNTPSIRRFLARFRVEVEDHLRRFPRRSLERAKEEVWRMFEDRRILTMFDFILLDLESPS